MIDLPHQPPASVQVIEQKLVECGLDRAGLNVAYSDLLQGLEVVIDPKAGASADHFKCIHEAAAGEFVTFKDGELYRAYLAYSSELARPMILERTRNELAKKGLLEGFPERRAYGSDKEFAGALETHCGLKAGEAISLEGGNLVLLPGNVPAFPARGKRWEQWTCLMSAIMYVAARDRINIGFIGNEAFSEPDGK